MEHFPLSLHHYFARDANSDLPVTPDELASVVKEVEERWFRVGADSSGAPYLRPGDYVQLAARDPSPWQIVGIEGATALAIGQAVRKPMACVRQVCRASEWPRYWIVPGKLPWRWLRRSLFQAADRWMRFWSQVVWTGQQFRPLPRLRDLEATVGWYYSQPGMLERYVPELAVGLSEPEQRFAARLQQGDRILDIGCGNGREALGFAEMGLAVTGMDASEEMITAARQKAGERSSLRFICRPGSEIDFPAGAFQAVYITPGYFQWIPGRRNRVAFLSRCRDLVTPGGVVMLSEAVHRRRSSLQKVLMDGPRRIAGWIFGSRVPEAGDIWSRDSEVPDSWAPVIFRHKYHDGGEIRAELEAAGLEVIEEVSSSFLVTPK